MTRWIRISLPALAAVLLFTASPPSAQTAEPPGVSAFILTFAGRPPGEVSMPVSDIRAAVSRELSSTILKRGPIVPPERMLGIMAARRVRDGNSIPRAFLDSLAVGLNVRVVLVTTVVVHQDRVTMAARYIDTATARLLDAVVVERHIVPARSEDPAEWIAKAREISRIVGDIPPPVSGAGRQPLLILDSQPVGCTNEEALIADHILLEHYTRRGDRVLIDPAVTRATLHDAGYSERYIGVDARMLLRDAFDCSLLAIPQLISYAPKRRSAYLIRFDADLPESAPLLTDFAMSLRLVDLESGSIRAGHEEFLPVPPPTGWFGVPTDKTLLDRMKLAADRLWTDLNTALEAF